MLRLSNIMVQHYDNALTKMRRVRVTLVMFYHALLTAWSDPPSSMALWTGQGILQQQLQSSSEATQHLSTCSNCSRQESHDDQNSTESAFQPQRVCCESVRRAAPQGSPYFEKLCNRSSDQLSACRGKKPVPFLVAPISDLSMGFRTSSEILVTM